MRYNAITDVRLSAAVAEPVTVAEFKQWAKIDVNDDDALIATLITAARYACELYTNTSFVDHTVTAVILNQLGGQPLPYGPVKAVTSTSNEDAEPITDAEYKGADFQRLKTCYENPVTIVYTTGYASLPEMLKTALKNQALFMYDNRGSNDLSPVARASLNQIRRF